MALADGSADTTKSLAPALFGVPGNHRPPSPGTTSAELDATRADLATLQKLGGTPARSILEQYGVGLNMVSGALLGFVYGAARGGAATSVTTWHLKCGASSESPGR